MSRKSRNLDAKKKKIIYWEGESEEAYFNGSITFSIGENIINTIFLLLGKIKRTFLSFYNTIKATKLY